MDATITQFKINKSILGRCRIAYYNKISRNIKEYKRNIEFIANVITKLEDLLENFKNHI